MKSLFRHALDLEEGSRSEFLRSACRNDQSLQRSLLGLLQHHEASVSVLAGPMLSPDRAFEIVSSGLRTFFPGELVAGRFRIERFIAEGGMGETSSRLRCCGDSGDQHHRLQRKQLRSGRIFTTPKTQFKNLPQAPQQLTRKPLTPSRIVSSEPGTMPGRTKEEGARITMFFPLGPNPKFEHPSRPSQNPLPQKNTIFPLAPNPISEHLDTTHPNNVQ